MKKDVFLRFIIEQFFHTGVFSAMILTLVLSSSLGGAAVDPVMPEKNKSQNRLAAEQSPYLRQHAFNPVDWYPWGDEAFEKAKREDKPIFLSIGYSTCHWCHVMARESFESREAAEVLNTYFVPVKVDREERPDIDHIYMKSVVAMRGQGGWPLTVFLTPDRTPFFGGTYFPLRAKGGLPGLLDLLKRAHDLWTQDREEIVQAGASILQSLAQETGPVSDQAVLGRETLNAGFRDFLGAYDFTYGGFSGAPKFPSGHQLSFLLRYWKRSGDAKALKMVEHTLMSMARGGIHDHLGGGFHRYATDPAWKLPHFEKMLYDQAILARVYLEAFQATGREVYAQVARGILDYVVRDLRHSGGGFYSAEDADSREWSVSQQTVSETDHAEGAFYLWSQQEIAAVLPERDAAILNYYFGVKPRGNLDEHPSGEFLGKNVLSIVHSEEETAAFFSRGVPEIHASLTESIRQLYEARGKRPRPFLDDKILADWNGLMISSLAFGSRVLDEPRYARAAQDAAEFILNSMVDQKGRLFHRYRDGHCGIPGILDDYAFFIYGLLDLYEATFDLKYLTNAITMTREMDALFWDQDAGGFYFTSGASEGTGLRLKEVYDGALPSGNSIAALVLTRLYHMSLQERFEDRRAQLFEAFAPRVGPHPSAYAQLLCAVDFAQGPSMEAVIASNAARPQEADLMARALFKRYLPNKIVLLRPAGEDALRALTAIAPYVEHQIPIDGETTAYLCENFMCKFPVRGTGALRDFLNQSN